MAKGIYFGVDGLARKVKKLYFGVDGVARKIKKMYFGIDGIARLCYSSGLAYAGTTDPLSLGRYNLCSAKIGNYQLFAGGYSAGNATNVVDYYDINLNHGTASVLGIEMFQGSGATAGGYAYIAGGAYSGTNTSTLVNAYDSSLTRSTASSLQLSRYNMASGQNSTYAFFAAGMRISSGTSTYQSVVDAYSSLTTKTLPTGLSQAKIDFACATVNDIVLFSGGYNSGSVYSTVDGYTNAGTKYSSAITALSAARRWHAGASNSSYAFFAGGYASNTAMTTVDIYDASLTRITSNLSTARYNLSGISTPDYAVFASGFNGSAYVATVDYFDRNLLRNSEISLATAPANYATGFIGTHILIAGGGTAGSSYLSTVSVLEY